MLTLYNLHPQEMLEDGQMRLGRHCRTALLLQAASQNASDFVNSPPEQERTVLSFSPSFFQVNYGGVQVARHQHQQQAKLEDNTEAVRKISK